MRSAIEDAARMSDIPSDIYVNNPTLETLYVTSTYLA